MKKSILSLYCLILLSAINLPAQDLVIRFIGNAAFEISDGEKTVLTDFPYKSGAFGYMHYDFDEVRPTGDVMCLITHNHHDHYKGDLMKADWALAAPPDIPTPMGNERIEWGEEMSWRGILIKPVKTPHTPEHHSYFMKWLDTTFFFTGDTENTDSLPKDTVDVLFVTPWLVESGIKQGVPILAHHVVIYHHRKNQKVKCEYCRVPRQGEVIILP